MKIPSLALGPHEHYSPELRDKISALLQRQADGPAYHLLTPDRLRSLIDIESEDEPVLSLYLQLDGARRAGGAWHTAFTSLRDTTLKPVGDRSAQQILGEAFNRIEQALADELPTLGKGVAFFACRRRDLWEQVSVAVPLPDGAYIGSKAYVRPLVRTQDEHDRFVLAVVSLERSRFFVSQIGLVEEVFQITASNPRKVVREHGPRDHGDGSVLDAVGHEARIFAHAAELLLTWFEGRSLLLSGPPELRADVGKELPKSLRQRVGEPFSVEIHAGPSMVGTAAQPAQEVIEAREESATVQRLTDVGPSGAAWGVQPTLNALRESRVATLVVDDTFTNRGTRCRYCGALWEATPLVCGVCGSGDLEHVSDVVEMAIEQALDERAALEMVRSTQARQMLARIGPMAAVLRW